MKKRFVYCLRLLVLLALTCKTSGAFAETISSNTTISSKKTYPEDVTINSGVTFTINSDVTINGNLTSKGGTIVIGEHGSLTITRNVTISTEKENIWRLTNENAKLIVKGDVIINEDKDLKINEGGGPEVEATYSGVIVVQGSIRVDKKAKVHINNNATVIVEGNLVLIADNNGNKNDAEIHVDHSACVTIKKQISGKGRIKIKMPDGGHEGNNGYIAVLGFNNDGTSIGNGLGIDQNKITLDVGEQLKRENDFLYIEGVSSLGDIATNNQSENSAYDQAISSLANYASLLPIELTSFTVSATEYGYTFNWVTASEVENDYFTLEFSEDGEEFIAIDYVHGAGTTSETSEYEYVWNAKPTADILYFRLKQTDYNGEYTYSDVIVSCRKKSVGATRMFRYGPLNLQVVDGELRYIAE